jgi:hypothetical protein
LLVRAVRRVGPRSLAAPPYPCAWALPPPPARPRATAARDESESG